MGTWPALVLIGVICGVWHLPFYVGPWFSMSGDALRSLLPFTIFCVFFGMVLGWLRLAAGSIWPAVVGHAVNNTVVFGFVQVVVADKAAEASIDGWLTGLSGWQGWLIMLIPVAVLAVRARSHGPEMGTTPDGGVGGRSGIRLRGGRAESDPVVAGGATTENLDGDECGPTGLTQTT